MGDRSKPVSVRVRQSRSLRLVRPRRTDRPVEGQANLWRRRARTAACIAGGFLALALIGVLFRWGSLLILLAATAGLLWTGIALKNRR